MLLLGKALSIITLVTLISTLVASQTSTTISSSISTSLSGTRSLTSTLSTAFSTTGLHKSSTISSNAVPTPSDKAPILTLVTPVPSNSSATTSSGSIASTANANNDDPSAPSDTSQSTGLVNYYFVFLAIIICVIGLIVYFIWRKRKRAASRTRNSRQNALERDLDEQWPVDNERWRDRRRWMHGHWRGPSSGGARAEDSETAEEGLDERGEAPPPYKPRPRSMVGEEEREHGTGNTGPRMPEDALLRDDVGMKPPDYDEMYVGSSRESASSPELVRPVSRSAAIGNGAGDELAAREHYAPPARNE